MDLFLQQIFNGVMLGSTYALVALGLTLVYGILQIPNFAHGHMYMLGAYVCLFVITVFGFAYWPAVAITAIIMAACGAILEWLCYRPLRVRHAASINSFISALGAMIVLENGAMALWGPQGQRIPNPYPGLIDAFGITMTQQRLLVIVVAVVLILLLHLFIKKTTLGSTIEAVAQDQEGAMLVGINVNWVSSMTFAISTALAAVSACLVAPIFMTTPSMGVLLGMKAFIICILGGLGSVPGAIFGGLILGIIEALGAGYISAAYKDVFAFGALILILAFKPMGLFGKEVTGR
jgi:branched-chain amino acid transport system permease protein